MDEAVGLGGVSRCKGLIFSLRAKVVMTTFVMTPTAPSWREARVKCQSWGGGEAHGNRQRGGSAVHGAGRRQLEGGKMEKGELSRKGREIDEEASLRRWGEEGIDAHRGHDRRWCKAVGKEVSELAANDADDTQPPVEDVCRRARVGLGQLAHD